MFSEVIFVKLWEYYLADNMQDVVLVELKWDVPGITTATKQGTLFKIIPNKLHDYHQPNFQVQELKRT